MIFWLVSTVCAVVALWYLRRAVNAFEEYHRHLESVVLTIRPAAGGGALMGPLSLAELGVLARYHGWSDDYPGPVRVTFEVRPS